MKELFKEDWRKTWDVKEGGGALRTMSSCPLLKRSGCFAQQKTLFFQKKEKPNRLKFVLSSYAINLIFYAFYNLFYAMLAYTSPCVILSV